MKPPPMPANKVASAKPDHNDGLKLTHQVVTIPMKEVKYTAKIGAGAYGDVWKATWRATHQRLMKPAADAMGRDRASGLIPIGARPGAPTSGHRPL